MPHPVGCARAARLYGVVLDGAGNPGPRQFVANLAEGAVVFALAAPGVCFLLHEQGAPCAAADRAGTRRCPGPRRWYGALLSAPGLPHGDAETEPLAPGDQRAFAAGTCVTARQILWLEAETPILLYPAAGGAAASLPTTRLVLANQTRAEIAGDDEVAAIDTATLLTRYSPAELGALSAPIAKRIAAALARRDAARRQRWRQTREIDETQASHALRRLRDVALFRPSTTVLVARAGQDALPGVLAILADAEGFELRMPLHDRVRASLFERLKVYAFASGFGFREIAITGDWWRRQGPPFIAVDGETGRPLAVLFRRRRWRIVDPETFAETGV